ncbi:hypothetical protein VIGAN_10100500, partial [Vigna angularis var. angularis]
PRVHNPDLKIWCTPHFSFPHLVSCAMPNHPKRITSTHKNDPTQQGIESSLCNFHFFLTQNPKSIPLEKTTASKKQPHFDFTFISPLLLRNC